MSEQRPGGPADPAAPMGPDVSDQAGEIAGDRLGPIAAGEGPADPAAPDGQTADPAAPDRQAADASLLALVDRLAAILERSELAELEVEAGGTALVLRSPAPAGAPQTGKPGDTASSGRGADTGGAGGAPPAGERTASRNAVLAPLTGVFYASPSPGSPPFVVAGREIAVGQVIGLIEAMKLFNEIKSDRSGRVVRLLADNGALVRARQPLVEVEPL
jgi:acetyl-CoA carboxylase biotin carboxyl carrier protein